MLCHCSCPRIIHSYGVYTQKAGFLGLVLEYCRNGDLRMLLDNKKETGQDLGEEQTLVILTDIAEVPPPLYPRGHPSPFLLSLGWPRREWHTSTLRGSSTVI